MAKQLPWYKRCPADWQHGTRRCGMSMELRGFYSECLDAMWELQGPLPRDGKRLALLLGCNPRTVAKLMPQLVSLGKIVETWYGYYNPRMMDDIAEPVLPLEHGTAARIAAEFHAALTRARAELASKVPENPTNTTREEESESESYSNPPIRDAIVEIDVSEGRVTIEAGLRTRLEAEYPGVDLDAVADLAAPDLQRFRRPSHDDKLAVVRKWCRLGLQRQHPARLRPTASAAAPAEVVPGWNSTRDLLLARAAARDAAAAAATANHKGG